ncbi:MAG TPA: RyR domain-containing protein, partial [Planctomycetota bacterium]|nr:RyR domain-containing protein [Planctomycetota bacterium]
HPAPRWHELDDEARNFNRQAADHVPVKMRAIGCEIVATQKAAADFQFTKDELELLAQMEHRRWRASRVLAGFRLGETADGKKDPHRKIHPLLVEWAKLPDAEKERARATVARIPAWLGMIEKGLKREAD